MWQELWPCGSRLCENERQYWDVAVFVVHRKFESIRQERLHHQAQLIFAGRAFRTRRDVESFLGNPIRYMLRQLLRLRVRQVIGKPDKIH
jgi:hypothetical protein